MKWAIALLALFVLAVSTPVVRADAPQPFQYALVKCSGLNLLQVTSAEQAFDTQYGWDHQLTTGAQWLTSYEARINEFASTLGCPQVLEDGRLTLWYRIYVPTYSRIQRIPQ